MIGLIPLIFAAIVIFIIAALIESKNTMKKALTIRSLYFHIISLITLGIVVGSFIALLSLGFKTWVFTEAEPALSRLGPPPFLYIIDSEAMTAKASNFLTCEEEAECQLTATQKESIESWEENYSIWQASNNNSGGQTARDAVNAFSFFIIALPFFIIHFRVLQKDAKKEENASQGVIRPIYFYFVSVVALVMFVVASGMMVNLGLKTWVFKSAQEAELAQKEIYTSLGVSEAEKTSVLSLANCADKCGLSQETKDLAEQWVIDYGLWEEANSNINYTQRDSASTLPFIIVGIPLFWYHFATVRKEAGSKKKEDNKPAENN